MNPGGADEAIPIPLPVLRLRLGTAEGECTFCPRVGECDVYQLWLDYDPGSERPCHFFAAYTLCRQVDMSSPVNGHACGTALFKLLRGIGIPFYGFCMAGVARTILPEGSRKASLPPNCTADGPCMCLRVDKPSF